MTALESQRADEDLPPLVRPGDEGISLLAVATVLLANRWKIITLGVSLAIVLVVVGLIVPRH